MQRAHQLDYAKDIVFVDSTASCDASGHSVTFMLTPCAVGAVPLAILITKGQSEDYKAGFILLKSSLQNSFSGQGHPKIFVFRTLYNVFRDILVAIKLVIIFLLQQE
ncbi:hypothetical protein NQ314_014113 [Rhamnusium bicolor]|uniref:MULE transposase domain-containing protein n=1 Tax=Rhamnusium bicolor TaxID=1586634 RepID=A0AAV8X3F6_9CUCU|nr:hypothetical protein NQ314_014113 [Rhamnusium bicolor]